MIGRGARGTYEVNGRNVAMITNPEAPAMPTAPPDRIDRLRAARVQALRAYEAARTRSLDVGDEDALAEKYAHEAAREVLRAAGVRTGRGGIAAQLRLAATHKTGGDIPTPKAVECLAAQPSEAILRRVRDDLEQLYARVAQIVALKLGPPHGLDGHPIRRMRPEEREP